MRKIIHTLITMGFVVGLLLSACSPKEALADLTGITWKLESYGGKSASSELETYLVFSDEGTLNGNVGCNSFSGSYQVSGNEITFGVIISTMMACEDSIMEQEYGVLSALKGTLTYQIKGSSLTLFATDGTSALELTASQ